MKKFILLLLLSPLSMLTAQTSQEISTGAGYKKQSFVNLGAGTETLIDATAWDLSFTVFGLQDAGIHINEGNGSSMGTALPVIELYDLFTDNFAEVPDPANYKDFQLFNDEKAWEYGAFNNGRDVSNPFDYGWGVYNPPTFSVLGSKVFLLKLRDNSYKKIQIQALNATVYKFRYANLDGSDEKTVTINKADHPGKTMAYFSFATGATVDLEPTTPFELIYCRYVSPVYDPGTMTYLPINVTGILHARGCKTAEADGVDPLTVNYADFEDSLKTQVDQIGFDWKSFSGTAWTLDQDRVFFLKTAQSRVWKLHFTAFGGSTTGKATFNKEDLGILSAVENPYFRDVNVLTYPNPATDKVYVAFEMPEGKTIDGALRVVDMQGKMLLQNTVTLNKGFQVLELNSAQWANGIYQLHLSTGNEMLSLGKVVK